MRESCRHRVSHPDGNFEMCTHAKRRSPDGIMPGCADPCPMGGPYPFGYYQSEVEGGCFLCTDGIPMRHDEDGYHSRLSIEVSREDEDSELRTVVRVVVDDEEESLMYTENFPANYCPICGKEL